MAENRLDLVIFGATGFTGQFVVEEVAQIAEEEGVTKWGIAGRNKTKLEAIRRQAAKETGKNLDDVALIVADVSDDESLRQMAKQAKVVVNCVGPYRFFGEQVVKACVENGASHVDVSGEPLFLEGMQLKYNEQAAKSGCYIIGACGFDSIPADLGITFLQQNFKGDLNSVEAYIRIKSGPAGYRGIHYGTFQSAIHGFANRKQLPPLRRQLCPKRAPKPNYRLQPRGTMHYSDVINAWCIPFPGTDRSVVVRTQQFNYDHRGQRAVQMLPYITVGSWFTTVFTLFAGAMFALMCSFGWTRGLLEKYPRFFSWGSVSHDGPTREQMAQTSFTMTFVGEGWKERLSSPSDQYQTTPDTNIRVEVHGPEPGYVATPICLVQAAVVILKEAEKMPGSGGVLPPGAAFTDTSLIPRLEKRGVTFQVV